MKRWMNIYCMWEVLALLDSEDDSGGQVLMEAEPLFYSNTEVEKGVEEIVDLGAPIFTDEAEERH